MAQILQMPQIAQIKLDHCNGRRRHFCKRKLFGKVWDDLIRKYWEGQILSPTNKQRRHAVAPTASRGLEFFCRIQPGRLQRCCGFVLPPAPAAAPRCSPSRFRCPHTPTNANRFRHLAGMFFNGLHSEGKVTQMFTGQSVASLLRWFGPPTLTFSIEPP